MLGAGFLMLTANNFLLAADYLMLETSLKMLGAKNAFKNRVNGEFNFFSEIFVCVYFERCLTSSQSPFSAL
jgi:hypothetical protein